jgi:hypothetical protein
MHLCRLKVVEGNSLGRICDPIGSEVTRERRKLQNTISNPPLGCHVKPGLRASCPPKPHSRNLKRISTRYYSLLLYVDHGDVLAVNYDGTPSSVLHLMTGDR